MKRSILLAVIWLCVGIGAAPVSAQLPQPRLHAIQPAGGQAGSEIELSLTSGDHLDEAHRLIFSHPGISVAVLKKEADRFYPETRPVSGRFKVEIARGVPPGNYEVRAVGYYGITNARTFVVGDGPEAVETEPNNTHKTATQVSVGTVVNGVCDETGFDYFRFEAGKGQRLIIDCAAQRIDSRADATLVLHDSSGRELKRSRDVVGRDPVIDFSVPADGQYVVAVYDFLYRGGARFPYRLTISAGPRIDWIDPPTAMAGAMGTFTLYGRNLPGGEILKGTEFQKLTMPVSIPADAGSNLVRGEVQVLMRPDEAALDLYTFWLAAPNGRSNPVRLLLGDEPLVRKGEPGKDGTQAITPPCRFVGRFGAGGAFDVLSFDAAKGDRYWIEIVSKRLSQPVDPLLVVQQMVTSESGEVQFKDVSQVDDQTVGLPDKRYSIISEDPAVLFTAPADGRYRILLRNQYGGSQAQAALYVLTVRPPKPDFRLLAMPVKTNPSGADNLTRPWTCAIHRGGAERIAVVAWRREGFNGEIQLEAKLLPEGIDADPAVIGEGSVMAEMVIRADEDAPAWGGFIDVVGRAQIGQERLTRTARGAEFVFEGPDDNTPGPWRLTRGMAMAVRHGTTPLPVSVQLVKEKTWKMLRGGKLQIPIRLVGADQLKGDLTLNRVGISGPAAGKIAIKAVTLNKEKPQAPVEVTVDPAAPLGTFSFAMAGPANFSYRRNPEAAQQAAADQKRIGELAGELNETAKLANEAVAQAETVLADARHAVQEQAKTHFAAQQMRIHVDRRTKQMLASAQQFNSAAEAAGKQATAQLAQARQSAQNAVQLKESADAASKRAGETTEAAAKIPAEQPQAKAAAEAEAEESRKRAEQARSLAEKGDAARELAEQAAGQSQELAEAAKTAADGAARQGQDLAAKAAAAAEALVKAEQVLAEGRTKLQQAETDLKPKMEAATKAKAEANQANEAKKGVDERVAKANETSKPADIKVSIPTVLVTLQIIEQPLSLKVDPAAAIVQVGGRVDLHVAVDRGFRFEEPINLELKLPEGASGLALAEATTIDKGHRTSKFAVSATDQATVGVHELSLHAKVRLFDRDFDISAPVHLMVMPAPVAP